MKQKLLNLALKTQKINIDDVGDLYIKEYTAAERESIEAQMSEQKIGKVRATMVTKALCDEKGKRLFNDDEIDVVNDLPISVIEKIFEQIQKLNGIGIDHQKN